jgi:hypothetical protein
VTSQLGYEALTRDARVMHVQALAGEASSFVVHLSQHPCTPGAFESPLVFCQPSPSLRPQLAPARLPPIAELTALVPASSSCSRQQTTDRRTFTGLDPRVLVLFDLDTLLATTFWPALFSNKPLLGALHAEASDASTAPSLQALLQQHARPGLQHIVSIARRHRLGVYTTAPEAIAQLAVRILTRGLLPEMRARGVRALPLPPA